MVFARRPVEAMPKRRKSPPTRKFTQLGIPGLELVEAPDGAYADGYGWYALVTDLDMDARDVLPLYRERGDCENVFDEMKNQWGWCGFTARTLAQTALFAGLSVIAANLWNVFTRLCDDGTHREAATSRPLLQSCVARISRHARQGVITIYTAANEKARGIYRAISAFRAKVASASQLGVEQRRQLIVAYALQTGWTGCASGRQVWAAGARKLSTPWHPEVYHVESHCGMPSPRGGERRRGNGRTGTSDGQVRPSPWPSAAPSDSRWRRDGPA